MALNMLLTNELESYGLTNRHLELLLAICRSGMNGAIIFNVCRQELSTTELRLAAGKKNIPHLVNLTKLAASHE
jgi:hypothetical protein